MALEIDDTTTVVGRIEVAVILKDGGEYGIAYGVEDLSLDAAIGHLMVVTDRMRDERRYEWDTAPDGEDWDAFWSDEEDE